MNFSFKNGDACPDDEMRRVSFPGPLARAAVAATVLHRPVRESRSLVAEPCWETAEKAEEEKEPRVLAVTKGHLMGLAPAISLAGFGRQAAITKEVGSLADFRDRHKP